MNKPIRKRIFEIIQIGNRNDIPSLLFDIFISIMIIFSVVSTFMLTFSELDNLHDILYTIELVTIIVFVIEYILRILTADFLYPGKKRDKAIFSFIFSLGGLIDLLTIVTFFLPFVFSSGLVAFRLLRVIRILRLFALTKDYDSFSVIYDVLMAKRKQLLSSIIMIFTLILMASLCMYSVEHDAQPEAFKNGFSGIWWCVSAIFTVGYGDIAPITIGGRILAVIVTVLGVLLVAIPTGIISAGFVEHISAIKNLTDDKEDNDFIIILVTTENIVSDVKSPAGLVPCGIFRNKKLLPIESKSTAVQPNDYVLFTTETHINPEEIS